MDLHPNAAAGDSSRVAGPRPPNRGLFKTLVEVPLAQISFIFQFVTGIDYAGIFLRLITIAVILSMFLGVVSSTAAFYSVLRVYWSYSGVVIASSSTPTAASDYPFPAPTSTPVHFNFMDQPQSPRSRLVVSPVRLDDEATKKLASIPTSSYANPGDDPAFFHDYHLANAVNFRWKGTYNCQLIVDVPETDANLDIGMVTATMLVWSGRRALHTATTDGSSCPENEEALLQYDKPQPRYVVLNVSASRMLRPRHWIARMAREAIFFFPSVFIPFTYVRQFIDRWFFQQQLTFELIRELVVDDSSAPALGGSVPNEVELALSAPLQHYDAVLRFNVELAGLGHYFQHYFFTTCAVLFVYYWIRAAIGIGIFLSCLSALVYLKVTS